MSDIHSAPIGLLAAYSLLILGASLFGGLLPLLVRLTHTRMQVATSFVAAVMLGVGVLHLLPHAWHICGSIDRVAHWFLGGFLVMFFVQRFLHFHHHDVPEDDPEGCEGLDEDGHSASCHHAPDEVHHDHTLAGKSARQLSWVGAALGLSVHTVINGVALAASVEADSLGGATGLLGLGTFLVIFLHKPFDALVISTLMTSGGWSRVARHLVNALFALVIPFGVALFYLGAGRWLDSEPAMLGAALAFAAGTFLCIAASDLLPELQFHSHDRLKLSVALVLGLGLALVIGLFEHSGHDHLHEGDALPNAEAHDH